jgi:putative chitinase
MTLSTHFTIEEATKSDFARANKIDNKPNATQLEAMKKAAEGMELLRTLFGTPILVSSWFRCPKLNVGIGGSATSSHTEGYAVDFTSPKFGDTRKVAKAIVDAKIKFDQLILEFPDKPNGGWVHISFAPAMRGQILTATKQGKKTVYAKGLN